MCIFSRMFFFLILLLHSICCVLLDWYTFYRTFKSNNGKVLNISYVIPAGIKEFGVLSDDDGCFTPKKRFHHSLEKTSYHSRGPWRQRESQLKEGWAKNGAKYKFCHICMRKQKALCFFSFFNKQHLLVFFFFWKWLPMLPFFDINSWKMIFYILTLLNMKLVCWFLVNLHKYF